jgi:hypothetical protein
VTQPQTAPAAQDHTGAVVAAAVTGLALIAVEARIRQQVEDDIEVALAAFAVFLLAVLAAPGVIIATGVQLMSRDDVHNKLVATITATRTKVAATVESGYTAAAQVAQTKAAADLAHDDYDVPDDLPQLDPNLDQISRDIDTMFGHAQTDLQNSIIAGYDGVQGPDADPARKLVVERAIAQAKARLAQRAQAAAATGVYQGARDAQLAVYREYANTTSRQGLAKRWVVTATDPCGMCEALNGTIVALDAEFDHDATTTDKDLRPVWRNLLGPPRHPNCRCQLELVTIT